MRLHHRSWRVPPTRRSVPPTRAHGRLGEALVLPLTLLFVVALAFPCGAGSATLVNGRPAILIGFGESYGPQSRTHSGIDISTGASSSALSAVGGVVTFVGLVPATGGDFRVGAVSVRTEEGHLVTLSPLDAPSVTKGEVVTVGQPIGVVAVRGDGSTEAPHLHLSERIGGCYVDPTHLLSSWFASYSGSGEGGNTGAAAPGGEAGVAQTAKPVTTRGQVKQLAPSAAPAAATVGLTEAPARNRAGSLSRMLARELASHPARTLGVSGVEAPVAVAVGAAADSEVSSPLDSTAAAPHVHGVFIDSIRYLGVGLVTLAAGLGFALRIVGEPGKNVSSRRLGSLFAVRGERW